MNGASKGPSTLATLALLAAVAVPARGASDVITKCMNFAPSASSTDSPNYVIAGMSLLRITGAASSSINHEAFFDGLLSGDSFSQDTNKLAGAHDCDQMPDARTLWGTAFDDNVANGCGTMSVTTNFFYMTDGNQAPGCAWTSAHPANVVRTISLNTCTGPNGTADIWHHSTSLGSWYFEGDGCGAKTVHTRALSVADATFSATRTENSCVRMWVGPEGNCPDSTGMFEEDCQ